MSEETEIKGEHGSMAGVEFLNKWGEIMEGVKVEQQASPA